MNNVHEKIEQFVSDLNKKFPKFEFYSMIGKKNARIVRKDMSSKSVYCFVRIADGALLKASGWRAPAEGVRGSVLDYDISKFDEYGGVFYRY